MPDWPGGEEPLSPRQRGQWLLHRLTPGLGLCNLATVWRTDRRLRWWPLQESLNHLVRRHPVLSCGLDTDGPDPRLRYRPEGVSFPLDVLDCPPDEVDKALADAAAAPLDLSSTPLARAYLVVQDSGSAVCLVLHHMIADHTSVTVLMRELAALYDAYAADLDVPAELAGPAPWYRPPGPDPATVDYWTRHLAGTDPQAMALATARPVPVRPTFAGEIIGHRLSGPARAAVTTLENRYRLTGNLVLLAAFFALLARHGAGPDLVIGVPVDSRPRAMKGAVGFHSSTLPIRVLTDSVGPVGEHFRRTRESFLLGLEHAAASFEDLQPTLGFRSADWRAPLFRHMFNFRPSDDAPRDPAAARSLARLDIEWEVWPAADTYTIQVRFSTEVHRRDEMMALLRRYEVMLIGLADSDPGSSLGHVPCLSAADRQLMDQVNATARPWPEETILAAVTAQAARQPGACGVIDGSGRVSYAELAERAAGAAAALTAQGVRPGDLVAVCGARSAGLAAAVLGCWLAGAAYLPLDPAHPPARLAYQLADAGVTVVLAGPELPAECTRSRTVLRLADLPATAEPGLVTPAPGLDDLAYVIYTSGSTGRPKGVELTHGNLANVVRHFAAELGLTDRDRVLWLTTFAFDISALELLMPLTCGATLVVAPDRARQSGSDLSRVLHDGKVTIAQGTPTTWRQLSGPHGRPAGGLQLLCGGEELSAALGADLLGHSPRRLLNVYGPTETTIWSTAAELRLPLAERIPLGLPIANTTVHVLDDAGRPVPPGSPGELCIGGAGVARGYRNRPELTEEKFRTAPGLGRYYRTGDLARIGPRGLEFLGRADRQIKLRGQRIELGEVESVLQEHPGVLAAAVVLTSVRGGQLLAAVQAAPDWNTAVSAAERAAQLRAHAAVKLSATAIPARFLFVDELPVTANGKVDAAAVERLADAAGDDGEPDELPVDDLLRTLVVAWREVLASPSLGPDANFFLSGGHSLLAGTLAERISAELGVTIGFEDVFGAATPRLLAGVIGGQAATG